MTLSNSLLDVGNTGPVPSIIFAFVFIVHLCGRVSNATSYPLLIEALATIVNLL